MLNKLYLTFDEKKKKDDYDVYKLETIGRCTSC